METPQVFISVDDYLQYEENSPIRHEYLGGQIFAMAGSSEEHNRIAANLCTYLITHLRGSGCKTFISDMKVKIQVAQGTADIFYYPDVMVTCDEKDREKFYKTHPCLVVEVLSPSTETIDRREKRLNYQSLASLQEYVLVSQDQMQVEVYRLKESGNWEVERLGPNDSLELNSVGLTLTLAEIYDEVFAG
ncbi:Uma2 family endonuclease [Phormidium pseudopriestleyi FRX01]|uniref:Uma2 family endonuclease n=1 Tax=Phormidium pseudopriestleyi FRX01 TaxID=1759528 RepID=A0ABS3FM39_9CYAN|nr:Uma2 family endonuclease [Phormidium pseudopriestleyi]MBO0348160.1 Uma2 family endonuclease [Phormidium pseudopriestleyi FRX01]